MEAGGRSSAEEAQFISAVSAGVFYQSAAISSGRFGFSYAASYPAVMPWTGRQDR